MIQGIKNIVRYFGFELKRIPKTGPNPIHLFETDAVFKDLYEGIKDHTLVDRERCFMLYQFFQQATPLGGEVAEVGVYRGGTAKLFGNMLSRAGIDRMIHLFDTFEGMPETSAERDLHKRGDFADTSLEGVSKYLSDGSFSLHKGFFPDTATPIKDKKFSFVHVDVDIYKSVLDCCEFFYTRLLPGGIMIFDDYGFISCPGAKQAVDEFFSNKAERPIYLSSGQCVVIKQ